MNDKIKKEKIDEAMRYIAHLEADKLASSGDFIGAENKVAEVEAKFKGVKKTRIIQKLHWKIRIFRRS